MNKKLIRIAGISVLTSFLFCLFPIGFIAFEGVTHAETEEIRINFQDNLLQVPDGYIPDFGEEYGEKNGYQYGWSANNRDNAAHRGICDDPRLDSLCTIKENATWDFGLASGYYYVTVSVGDAVYGSGQTVELDVEGVPFFRDAVLEAGDFLQETKRVAVADGKLTIRKANQQSNIPVNYVHITPEQDPVHSVRLEMYNANRTDRINTIFPWYKLYNTGNEPISLEDVKIRYYYTIDGERPQTFWCDWSDKGKDNITGMFVKLGEPFEGATHYFEAGFLSGAGTLGIGESVELHLRIAKTDWTDYIQSNDYSFNVSATGYVEWEKVCVYINSAKAWGQEIQAPVPTPTATSLSPPTVTPESTSTPTTTPELTSTPTPTSSPESTPESTPTTSPTSSPTSSPSTTPTTTPTASPSPTPIISPSPSPTPSPVTAVELFMYNLVTTNETNTIYPMYKLVNTGSEPVNLSDVTIRYYYTINGEKPQNSWCDWSNRGSGNITGRFVRMELIGDDRDYWFETGFSEGAGMLEPGEEIFVNLRIAKTNWSDYFQNDDYSFNPTSGTYVKWEKTPVYISGELVFGTEPSGGWPRPIPTTKAVEIHMLNANRSDRINTIFPQYRIFNTGDLPIELSSLVVRYYYTVDGEKPQNFWCDWSTVGASNVTGQFIMMENPLDSRDCYLQMGFTDGAGVLLPGEYIEVHTRMAKTDWSDYSQNNDYSFNSSAGSFTEWRKVSAFIDGLFVWGEGDLVDVPENLRITGVSENTVTLSWDAAEGASGYEILADGSIIEGIEGCGYTHEGLDAGTFHSYRVRTRTFNTCGPWSGQITTWTLPGVPQVKSITPGTDRITIEWYEVTGATGYQVYVDNSIIIDCYEELRYVHKDLGPNTNKSYRVRALNSSGEGKWSDLITCRTLPAIPGNFISVSGDSWIELKWEASSGASGYEIEIDEETIVETEEPKYLHINLSPCTRHTYRVRAVRQSDTTNDPVNDPANNPTDDSSVDPAYGAVYDKTPWSAPYNAVTTPSIPADFTAQVGTGEVLLTWAESQGAEYYELEIDGELFGGITGTEYLHGELGENTTHTYRIRSCFENAASEWSSFIEVTMLAGVPAITELKAGTSKIQIYWGMVEGAESFEIEADGQTVDVGLATSYTHTGLLPNTEHTYRVRAGNKGGFGQWSAAVTAKTLMAAPPSMQYESGSTWILVTWSEVDGAERYELSVDGTLIDNGTLTYFRHEPLQPDSHHVYRVRAVSGSYTGEWSNAVVVFTMPGIPSELACMAKGDSIILSFNAAEGADSYEVEADSEIFAITGTTYTHVNLEPGSIHTYRVRSVNINGKGDWSDYISWQAAPGMPKGIEFEADTRHILFTWQEATGADSYDVLPDEVTIIKDIMDTFFVLDELEPNTLHTFSVRARNSGGTSEWTEPIKVKTTAELSIDAKKDNEFNFVIVAPDVAGRDTCTIEVMYNPDELEVLDLCAITPEAELEPGAVTGTDITVTSFEPGRITYTIGNANRTVTNSIRFLVKANGHSKIVYEIKQGE